MFNTLELHAGWGRWCGEACSKCRAAFRFPPCRQPGLSLARCWATLLSTYQDAWSRRHPVLALLPSPPRQGQGQGGEAQPWLATVRAGATLGVVRPAAPAEVLAASQGQAGATSAPNTGSGNASLSGAVAVVAACAQEVSGLLGCLAQDAFVSLLVSGAVCAVQTLVPHFTALILEGPGAAGLQSSSAPRDDVAREQHAAWRQRRQRVLLRLGQVLGALPNPAAAIQQYCEQLQPALGILARGSSERQPSFPSTPTAAATLLVSSACQVAHAHICAARDVLLLLGVIVRTRAIGTVPLDGAQLAALQPTALAPLAEVVQRASVAYWLCSTPATAVAPATELDSPTKALATLKLGGMALQQPTRASWGQDGAPPRDVSLAAKLLPSLAPALLATAASGMQHALAAAQALAVEIQYGASSGRGAGGKAGAPEPVSSQILRVGHCLFLAGEFAPLSDLTKLAQQGAPATVGSQPSPGSARDSAGPELLRGLGLVCRLGELSREARVASAKEAAGCFFRAAAAMHANHGRCLTRLGLGEQCVQRDCGIV